MSAITTIIVIADDKNEAAEAVCHALVAWLAAWRGLDEPVDDSDATCERVLAWLRAN